MTMRRHIARSVLGIGLLLAPGTGAFAERLALVIGNADYARIPKVRKALADASAIEASLKRLGFKVISVEDADHEEFAAAIESFGAGISPGDEIVVHYSGHGVSIDGRNYLLPIDIKAASAKQGRAVQEASFDAAEVIDGFRKQQPTYVFAILDANRDNPFGKRGAGLPRGLSPMEAESGTLILMAAGPGEASLDRLGAGDSAATSPFIRTLAKHMKTPGLALPAIAGATRLEMYSLALAVSHRQYPAYSDGTTEELALAAPPAQESKPRPNRVEVPRPRPEAVAAPEDSPAAPEQAPEPEVAAAPPEPAPEPLPEPEVTAAPPEPAPAPQVAAAPAPRQEPAVVRPDPAPEPRQEPAAIIPAPAPAPEPEIAAKPEPAAEPAQSAADAAYEAAIRDGSEPALAAVVRAHPEHPRASEVLDILEARADDAAFALAGQKATAAAYEVYRREYPHGRHLAAVEAALAALQSAPAPSPKADAPAPQNTPTVVASLPEPATSAAEKADATAAEPAADSPIKVLRVGGYDKKKNGADIVTTLDFSPDGRTLAWGGLRGVRLWDVANGRFLRLLEGGGKPENGYSRSVRFTPDGRTLVTGGDDNVVKLWDVETGNLVRVLAGHEKGLATLAVSHDGRMIATGGTSLDKSVKLWDLETGELLRTIENLEVGITGVAFSPDGRSLVVVGTGMVKFLDPANGQVQRAIPKLHDTIKAVAFSPDGQKLLGTTHGSMMIWDVESMKLLRTIEARTKKEGTSLRLYSGVWSPDGSMFVAGSNDGTSKVWDSRTNRLQRSLDHPGLEEVGVTLPDGTNDVNTVVFSPDGRLIASGGAISGVRLWEATTGRLLAEFHSFATSGEFFARARDWVAFGVDGYVASPKGQEFVTHVSDPQSMVDKAYAGKWLKESLSGLAPTAANNP